MIREVETRKNGGPAASVQSEPAVTREAIAEDLSAGILFPDEIHTVLNLLREMR